MIKIIFIIIILIGFIILNFYYQNKIDMLKHQLRIQTINKNSTKSNKVYLTNIQATFSTPESIMGIINENVNLLIAPIKNSSILRKTDVKMEVKILDKVTIDNQTWYYVSLPINKSINSRGWVNKKDFTIMYSQSKDLSI